MPSRPLSSCLGGEFGFDIGDRIQGGAIQVAGGLPLREIARRVHERANQVRAHDRGQPGGGPYQPLVEFPRHAENQRAVRPRPGPGLTKITGSSMVLQSRPAPAGVYPRGRQGIHAFIMPLRSPGQGGLARGDGRQSLQQRRRRPSDQPGQLARDGGQQTCLVSVSRAARNPAVPLSSPAVVRTSTSSGAETGWYTTSLPAISVIAVASSLKSQA